MDLMEAAGGSGGPPPPATGGPTMAVSLWQPWASLVALGVKTIETRSWGTRHRGRLVICAAKSLAGIRDLEKSPDEVEASAIMSALAAHGATDLRELPRGEAVATCELVASCPMTDDLGVAQALDAAGRPCILDGPSGLSLHLCVPSAVNPPPATARASRSIEAQRVFGYFAAGRHGWVLGDIRPTEERCPTCWGSGSWPRFTRLVCSTCGARRAVGSVPARGKQGLWAWEPPRPAAPELLRRDGKPGG